MSQEQVTNVGEEYVVVAEDSPPNRTILVLLLKKLGYKVLECEDGEIAWAAMKKMRTKILSRSSLT